MSPDRVRRARELFEAAASTSGAAREALMSQECHGDAELRGVVQRMLQADGEANAVLDQPLPAAAEATQTLPPGSTVGECRILREIGSGGMGTVYLARRDDRANGEACALKIMRWASPELSRRFRQEQSILRRLEHRNIARLLDSGEAPGERPYFVMEYVEGEPIHRYCEHHGLNTEQRVRLFRQVCAAVQYLHQNLVIHRDLKPANILVTADGTVKLLDFGIAKLLQGAEMLRPAVETSAGLMTPDYASPEQIRGEPATTLTDVYALGILLYELLAGVNPFAGRGAPVHTTLQRICDEEPEKPSAAAWREAGRRVRGELDNIALKAIGKEPQRRYASVEQLDEDARRYLAGLPVAAHGDSLPYRARKFVARHRGPVAAAAAMLLVLVGGIVATTYEAGIARRERERAEAHAREAERARAIADRERVRAKEEAATAQRERANAERRLAELRSLADGVVKIYSSVAESRPPDMTAALIAESASRSVAALQGEGALGLEGLQDRTFVSARSFQLAADATWNVPRGWSAYEAAPREYRVGTDRRVVHSGAASLFLRSLVTAPNGMVMAAQQFSATAYQGKRVRLTAWLRGEALSDGADLTLSVVQWAGETVTVRGTTPWKRYELVMNIPAEAQEMAIYLMMRGSGTLWADDFDLEPVSDAAPLTRTRRQPENLNFTKGR